MSAEERFWSKVKRGRHWTWQGRPNGGGYGRITVDGKLTYAHVYSYRLLVAEVPEGLQIDHLCRVRLCVKPDHLEAVPQRVNLLRGKGITAVNAMKTHCVNGHPLVGANLYMWRGCRRCKRCNADTAARRRHQGR